MYAALNYCFATLKRKLSKELPKPEFLSGHTNFTYSVLMTCRFKDRLREHKRTQFMC